MPSSIISPFPVFNDLDGSPLENGYIFIGQSNLNPETAPVNVFWDAARTIPAAQPIRTIGGFPSRNGSPSNVYVENNTYSITVRNKQREFVYNSASTGNPIFAGYPITRDQLSLPILGTDSSFVQAGAGAVTRTMQDKARETVSPKDFGAIGNGVANDTAAVLSAIQSGFVVDGGGLTYGISGTMQPSSFKGLRNANFVQLAPTTAGVATLYIYALSDWFIDNCKFDMGSVTNTGSNDDSSRSALRVGNADGSYCENFRISGVTVTGDGNGSRIQVRQAKRFTITECLVHDCVAGFTPDPTDDIINGFDISDCANFTISNCNVYNLKCILSGAPANRYTRGFLFTEIRDCTITGCNSTVNDQAFDFSGAVIAGSSPLYYEGNRRFTIIGCTANNAGTYGFKFANVTKSGLVSGCIANNSGNIGFVFSPSAVSGVSGQYNTQNIDVVGCKVVNVLGSGTAGTNAEGFRVMSNLNYPSYPRGIRFVGCSVSDTQNTPTTLIGFASDAAPVVQPSTGYNTNIANYSENCSVGPGVTTSYSGIGSNLCSITSSSNQTINDSTWTSIDFPVNLTDNTGLHSAVSNVDTIIIKVPGTYSVMSRVQFSANATGSRRLRLMVNGSESSRTQVVQPAASTVMTVQSEGLIRLSAGDAVRVEAYQTSGAPLQLNLTESILTVCRIN